MRPNQTKSQRPECQLRSKKRPVPQWSVSLCPFHTSNHSKTCWEFLFGQTVHSTDLVSQCCAETQGFLESVNDDQDDNDIKHILHHAIIMLKDNAKRAGHAQQITPAAWS